MRSSTRWGASPRKHWFACASFFGQEEGGRRRRRLVSASGSGGILVSVRVLAPAWAGRRGRGRLLAPAQRRNARPRERGRTRARGRSLREGTRAKKGAQLPSFPGARAPTAPRYARAQAARVAAVPSHLPPRPTTPGARRWSRGEGAEKGGGEKKRERLRTFSVLAARTFMAGSGSRGKGRVGWPRRARRRTRGEEEGG